jgi:hypothetical protein
LTHGCFKSIGTIRQTRSMRHQSDSQVRAAVAVVEEEEEEEEEVVVVVEE